MAGPSEFMVGNAPGGASYGGRLMDFSSIANLPEDYYKGQALRREQAAATAFPDGPPTLPNGQIDTNAILKKGTEIYGVNFVQALVPLMLRQQWIANAYGANPGSGGAGEAEPGPGSHNPSGVSPANFQATKVPAGQASVNTLVGAFGGNPDTAYGMGVAKKLGLQVDDPTARLNPADAKKMVDYFNSDEGKADLAAQGSGGAPRRRKVADRTDDTGQQDTGEGAGGSVSGAPGPVATPAQRTQGTQQLTEAYRKAGISNAPAPTNAPATGGPSQAPRPQQVAGNVSTRAGYFPSANAMLPPDYKKGPAVYAQEQDALARDLRRRAGMAEAAQSGAGKPLVDEADKASGRAHDVREAMGKDTGRRAEAQEKESDAMFNGIEQGATNWSARAKEINAIAKGIHNNPNMYSGSGSDFRYNFEKIKEAFGGQADTATLQQMSKKVTAQNLLNQLESMKADMQQASPNSSAGRVFAQHIETMKDAITTLENTPEGNRALLEIERRHGEMSVKLADMAEKYRENHGGVLDDGWHREVREFLDRTPIFTDEELAHPQILGAPEVPKKFAGSAAATYAWTKAMGLKPGKDAIRLPMEGLSAPKYVVVTVPRAASAEAQKRAAEQAKLR